MSKKRKRRCQPRILRAGEAPGYLGVDRNRFNSDFRPHLTEWPIGLQAIGFDRYEMDRLIDEILATEGHPGRPYLPGKTRRTAESRRVSSKDRALGISTSRSTGSEFTRALAQLAAKNRSK